MKDRAFKPGFVSKCDCSKSRFFFVHGMAMAVPVVRLML